MHDLLEIETTASVAAYDRERASRYDQFASVTMGNRRLQHSLLLGLLERQSFQQGSFVDLGCGTGFFAEAFFQHMPDLRGHLVDGSGPMIELAKRRLTKEGRRATFYPSMFDAFDWSVEESFDVVFSAFAIHHLPDIEKWKLFATIETRLASDGAFILFDNFLPREPKAREIIEYLTCREIAHRARTTASIDQVIETDRRIKEAENDQEASFEEHLQQLRAAGFGEVVPVFLEGRYGGIVAYKRY